MHNYLAGGVGGRPVKEAVVMGHESSGEVIAVGDLVTTHKVGDRVAGKFPQTEPRRAARRMGSLQSSRDCRAGAASTARTGGRTSVSVSILEHAICEGKAHPQTCDIVVRPDPSDR